MKKILYKIASSAISSLLAMQLFCLGWTNVPVTAADTTVRTDFSGRKMEKLNRGVSAVSTGKEVFFLIGCKRSGYSSN